MNGFTRYPQGITQVRLADTTSTDSFGRLRVSNPTTLFDSQQEYGLNTRYVWTATANGSIVSSSSNGSVTSGSNAVGPTDSNSRLTPITVSTTNGHYSILQSQQYPRYIPGKSHLIFITGIFASGSGSTASFVLRSSCSGSVVDTAVDQSNWNLDKMDGTGPSGVTIDFTKVQILCIDAQMLYAGRIRFGFDIDGQWITCHEINIANSQSLPTLQAFCLPVRAEIRNTGASESKARFGYFDSANGVFLQTTRSVAGGTVNFLCCSVQSEGGEEIRGFPWTCPSGIVTVSVTTRRPVISIRPKTTFNSRTNRGHIEEIVAFCRATTNDSLVEIVYNGTLTGAAFASVNSDSITEYDTTATAISGGIPIHQFFAASGSGVTSGTTLFSESDLRNPLVLNQIDALTATQNTLSIVATSFSGTSNLTTVLNWTEQLI